MKSDILVLIGDELDEIGVLFEASFTEAPDGRLPSLVPKEFLACRDFQQRLARKSAPQLRENGSRSPIRSTMGR